MNRSFVVVTAGCCLTLIASYVLSRPLNANLQWVCAGVVLAAYIVLTLIRPTVGLLSIAATIPFLGMVRRILFEQSQPQVDPMLLIIPCYTVFMITMISTTYRARLRALVRESRTTRLLLLLIGLCILEILNPLQGGLSVGAAGAIYYIVPLCWFILGRVFLTEDTLKKLLVILILVPLIFSVYGLLETFVGFTGFDRYWVDSVGYVALNVSGTIRTLGPATSAAEYASFLAVGTVLLLTLAIFRRSLWLIVPAIVPFVALILESSRTVVLTCLASAFLLFILRRRSKGMAVVTVLLVVLGVSYVYHGSSQYVVQSDTASPIQTLLAHQVNGLAHPLDRQYSTGQAHITVAIGALVSSVRNPFGMGLGATTLAALKFGGSGQTAEYDFVDMFLATGLIGGILYLIILVRTVRSGMTLVFREKRVSDALALAALIATLGETLNGSYYSLMPILWMLVAWLDTRWCEQGLEAMAQDVASEGADATGSPLPWPNARAWEA